MWNNIMSEWYDDDDDDEGSGLKRTGRRNVEKRPSSCGSTERGVSSRIASMNVILNLVKRLLEYSESEQQSDQNHHCDQTNAQHARLRSETHLDFFFPFYLFNFFFFLRRQSRTVVFRWILKSVNWVHAQFYR